jgi:uncharacterized phage protein (TIGR02218 family)
MAGRRRIVRVGAVEEASVEVEGLEPGAYAFGTPRWLTGDNAGMTQAVTDNDGDGLTLADPSAFAVTAGELALLTQGCDRQLATCAARFGNAVNFRGEPYLPGMDLLTRYPGA